MKRMLVTGGAGFIGSNFIKLMLETHETLHIVNLDSLTYAGNLQNLSEVENHARYTFVCGDICDITCVDKLFAEYKFESVIHFAAESHVDRSIENAAVFLNTNILGTQVLLDCAKKYWSLDPADKHCRDYREGVRFVQVSTDEVYGSLGETGLFTELTPLSPRSPYSASKASADHIASAYYETYGLPVMITRCSNNYGPNQFPEKLIPLIINNCFNKQPIPVYGDGLQVRDWLFVKDHCLAIERVLACGNPGEVYNIGGNNEKTNIAIVKLLLAEIGESEDLITYVKDRPGHDRRYAIDNGKITRELGWSPTYTFEQGIKETVRWYLANRAWMDEVTSGRYTAYYDKMYE